MNDAEFIGGLWIPAGDEQLRAGLNTRIKPHKRPIVDGEIAWQYHRIDAAIRLLPAERRRVVVDAGAHIGLWTRWLVRRFEFVHAFEPVTRHWMCLEKNVRGQDQAHLHLHRCALGERMGMVTMTAEKRISGRSHVVDDKAPGFGAALQPLDDFGLTGVDLVKIDVEGYERKVLLGGEETIRRDKPVIVIEQLGHEARYGEPRDAALDLLKSWGAVELQPDIKGDHYLGWE